MSEQLKLSPTDPRTTSGRVTERGGIYYCKVTHRSGTRKVVVATLSGVTREDLVRHVEEYVKTL